MHIVRRQLEESLTFFRGRLADSNLSMFMRPWHIRKIPCFMGKMLKAKIYF